MSYEHFTNRSRRVLQFANSFALKVNSEFINSEFILIGLIQEHYGLGGSALIYAGVTVEAIEKIFFNGILQAHRDNTKPLLQKAVQLAGTSPTGTEHILLAILETPECNAYYVLSKLNLLELTKEKLNNILQTGECFAKNSVSLADWGKLSEDDRKQALIDFRNAPTTELVQLYRNRLFEYEEQYEMDTETLKRKVEQNKIPDWDTIGHWMMLSRLLENTNV